MFATALHSAGAGPSPWWCLITNVWDYLLIHYQCSIHIKNAIKQDWSTYNYTWTKSTVPIFPEIYLLTVKFTILKSESVMVHDGTYDMIDQWQYLLIHNPLVCNEAGLINIQCSEHLTSHIDYCKARAYQQMAAVWMNVKSENSV